jgi:hypothetical protein
VVDEDAEVGESAAEDLLNKAPETYALYNTVKLDIFQKYKSANHAIVQIGLGRDRWGILKSLVVALYFDFEPKLDKYIKEKDGEKFLLLKEILNKGVSVQMKDGTTRVVNVLSEPAYISFLDKKDTMKAFSLLRELLERNGITKYESSDMGMWI